MRFPSKSLLSAGIASLAISLGLFGGIAQGSSTDCGQCDIKEAALEKLRGEEKDLTELQKKNEAYLKGLKPDESSKAIKLRSNLTMIDIKISGLRDSIVSTHLEISKQCQQCKLSARLDVPQGESR
jgi:hypothetical protein